MDGITPLLMGIANNIVNSVTKTSIDQNQNRIDVDITAESNVKNLVINQLLNTSFPLLKVEAEQIANRALTSSNVISLYFKNKFTRDKNKKAHEKNESLEFDPVVGGYVARNIGFRNSIINLNKLILNYTQRQNPRRPLNILLASPPGSGKSFLIKQIAKELGDKIVFEEYHVAAMRSLEDLFSVFKKIQSCNLDGKMPIILLDEVDGSVNGRHILSNLLAPMADGSYHYGQDSYSIGKVVFVFAASALVTPPDIDKLWADDLPTNIDYDLLRTVWTQNAFGSDVSQLPEKALDFLSRIDEMVCIPPLDERIIDSDSFEVAELILMFIRKHFPKVNKVEQSAVHAVLLEQKEGFLHRQAESVIFRSQTSIDNQFKFEDLPDEVKIRTQSEDEIKEYNNVYFEIDSWPKP